MLRAAPLALSGTLAAFALCPVGGHSQSVLIHAVSAETSAPVVGAVAHLLGEDGRVRESTLTDRRGRGLFVGVPAGLYRVRVEMIGMATTDVGPFQLSDATPLTRVIRLESSPIELDGLEVQSRSDRCSVRPGSDGMLVSDLWDEARKALEATAITDRRDVYRYETLRYERQIDRDTGAILREERFAREGYMKTPYESHPAEDLIENGFVRDGVEEDVYMAPDASVLLSDTFLDTHCFHLAGYRDAAGPIGLGFRPTGDRKRIPDIAGTMWIDPETGQLQWLEYTYRHLEPERTSPRVGGRVDFRRLPDGTWIVPRWWIRMPVMAMQTDLRGRRIRYIERYQETGGLVVGVREAGGRSLGATTRTGGIEGVVRDSVGVPLQGVRVGIIGSGQEIYSNSRGEFGITGLPAGRYRVRLTAPSLDAVGYEPEPVLRDVVAGQMTRLDHHLPSRADALTEQCEGVGREPEVVVLVGVVADSAGRPVPEVEVRVQWHRYDFSGVRNDRRPQDLRQIPHVRETSTDPHGRFRFCSIPSRTRLLLQATTPSAASDEVALVIPEGEAGAVRILGLVRNPPRPEW